MNFLAYGLFALYLAYLYLTYAVLIYMNKNP